MERLARALSIIQQAMRRNNPRHVTESVNEVTEVLGGMLNTHKCLLESGVKIQKKMGSHPAMKKLGIFQRPRSASLGDTPKNPAKGEKRSVPSPPLEKTRGLACGHEKEKEKKEEVRRRGRRTLCKKQRGLLPSRS